MEFEDHFRNVIMLEMLKGVIVTWNYMMWIYVEDYKVW